MITDRPVTNFLSLVPFFVWILFTHARIALGAESLKSVTLQTYSVDTFNADLVDGLPTVDIKVYNLENGPLDWNQITEALLFSKQVFAQAGVQLRISGAKLIRIPRTWRNLIANSGPQFNTESDFYTQLEKQNNRLTFKTRQVFDRIIENEKDAQRTIHVVVLDSMTMNVLKVKNVVPVATGAYSFPTYMYLDSLPTKIRGVISLQTSYPKALAHELGHKLINVSHEWRDICPQFETDDGQGLMTYGTGVDIGSGLAGRWHRERLLKSPFVYHIANRRKIWNPPFKNQGRYRDAIYQGQYLTPACSVK